MFLDSPTIQTNPKGGATTKKQVRRSRSERRKAKGVFYGFLFVATAIVLGFIAAEAANGQETSAEVESKITVTTGFNAWDKYFGQNGSSFYDGPVLQPEVTVGFGDHWSLNLWGSQGADNSEAWQEFDDEFDVTMSYAHHVGDYNLTYGVAYFILVERVPGDIVRPTFEITRDFAVLPELTLTPYAITEGYFPTRGGQPKSGAMQRVGAKYSWTPGYYAWVNGRLGVFYDTGSFGFGEGFLAELRAALNWKATRGVTVALPSIKCASGLTTGDRSLDCGYGIQVTVAH